MIPPEDMEQILGSGTQLLHNNGKSHIVLTKACQAGSVFYGMATNLISLEKFFALHKSLS